LDARKHFGLPREPARLRAGTAMAYNGMSDVEDRANLIAYLATFQ
jgi:cytochrome c